MKTTAAIAFALLSLFMLHGCGEPNNRVKIRTRQANLAIPEIVYIKDGRTGICFAFYWGGGGEGGPALATVPCSAVQSFLK